MKLLFITGSLNQGGAEYQILELAKLFKSKGHEVEVFAVTYHTFYLPFIDKNEIKYSHLLNSQGKLKRVWLTKKKIDLYKPDIVISFLRAVSLVSLIAKIFSVNNCKFIVGERTSLILKNYDLFYFNLMRLADIITVNSISKEVYLKKRFPYLQRKVYFFPNIIDVFKFNHIVRINRRENFNFGYVGRIAPEKNVLNLVKAFHKALKKYSTIKLELYGEAKNLVYLQEIKNYIEVNELKKSIFIKGATNNVSKVYQNLDALCLLSDYEGFSNVLSEALCSGLPIITSDVPENTFLIEDLKNGFVVNQRDVDSIISGIEKMLNISDADLLRIKSNNRNKAEHIFDREKIYEDYMALIKEIM